jgi:hypothetical protein
MHTPCPAAATMTHVATQLRKVVPVEGVGARQQLKQYTAQGPGVAAAIVRHGQHHLWGRVEGCANLGHRNSDTMRSKATLMRNQSGSLTGGRLSTNTSVRVIAPARVIDNSSNNCPSQ